MNKITCDMCMDLMPLVKDGIASADSREAVEPILKPALYAEVYIMAQPPRLSIQRKHFHKLKQADSDFFSNAHVVWHILQVSI